jgi:hypothetical protein
VNKSRPVQCDFLKGILMISTIYLLRSVIVWNNFLTDRVASVELKCGWYQNN